MKQKLLDLLQRSIKKVNINILLYQDNPSNIIQLLKAETRLLVYEELLKIIDNYEEV